MKVLRKHFSDGKKCPGCGWETSEIFAYENIWIDRNGICAQCFMELVMKEGLEAIDGDPYHLHEMVMPKRGRVR